MFLQMLDGAEQKEGIVTIFATNYPWILDSAVLSRVHSKVSMPILTDAQRRLRICNFIRERTQGQNVERILGDTLVKYLVEYTGFRTPAKKTYDNYFRDMGVDVEDSSCFDKHFSEKDYKRTMTARHTFGFSQRDLTVMLDTLLDTIRYDKITQVLRDGNNCSMYPIDNEIIQCDDKIAGEVSLTVDDIQDWFHPDKINFKSKLTPSDFLMHMYYEHTDMAPLSIRELTKVKETST